MGLVVAAVLMTGPSVFAQSETGAELQAIVAGLRAEHQSLKAQVDAGEITKEEAHAIWQARIKEVRVAKEEHYAARMEKAQARIARISEKNPEVGAKLQTRLDESVAKRAAWKAELGGIREQIKSGEITREQAQEIRAEVRSEQKDYKADLKIKRDQLRAEHEVKKAERKLQKEERRAKRPGTSTGTEAETE